MGRRALRLLFLALMLVLLVGPARRVGAEEPCLASAWTAFNSKDYSAAVQAADQCIDDFGRAADRQEAELQNEPVTKPGRPPTEFDKNRIFAQGVLNDVATAYFVKGRAAEAQSQKVRRESERTKLRRTAKESYEAACRYKHALTWDPRNASFWSPCQAASDRLPLKGATTGGS
jgi:hypothetical protein